MPLTNFYPSSQHYCLNSLETSYMHVNSNLIILIKTSILGCPEKNSGAGWQEHQKRQEEVYDQIQKAVEKQKLRNKQR